MKVAIVILNWNTSDYLEKFLPPLLDSVKDCDAEVIVADNASTDGSMEMMEEEFPGIRRIVLDRNYGFTGGYNKVLPQIRADYYVLMNSDIEVPPGWLEPLVEWMDSHPGCGTCGPKLLSFKDRDSFEYAGAAGGLMDRWGYPFCRGRILSRVEKDNGQYDSPARVFWVSGACLMTRSCLWERFSGLDGRYFAHMEEIDYCWRLQLEGFSVDIVPSSTVYHVGGGTLPQGSAWKLKLNYRNNLLMLRDNLPRTYVSDGEAPAAALRHARRTVFQRKCLDGCSAAAYLFSGRWKAFRAVMDAHREASRLNRPWDSIDMLETWRSSHRAIKVEGRYSGSIVAAALFKGKGVAGCVAGRMKDGTYN